MRPALHLRVAAIGISVMAVTLLMAAFLTYQLIRVGDRQELDRVLRQELDEVQLSLPGELRAAAGGDATALSAEAELAVERFLAVNPGSARHLTVIRIGATTLSTRDGPPALKRLQRQGTLPDGEPGSLLTVDTDAGPVRVLSSPLVAAEQQLGSVTISGPLSDGLAQANEAFVRIILAGAIGLVLGGLLLLLAVRRALRPVRELASAARSVDSSDLRTRLREPDRLDEVGLMAHEFNRMLDRVAEGERKREQLLSAVSHELRTPLAVARGHLEIFETLGPSDGASAADTAQVVRQELDRLGRIVDDLTAVSRGDLGGAPALGPVFVPDVLAALRQRLIGLGLCDVPVMDGPPVVVLGDQDRITQALLNLVVNARTHTPVGTPVDVSAHANADHVILTVADQGPGIDPAVLPRVFEPFVTTRPAGASRATGLGLTVVKAVTEAQGGNVDLRTGPGGTTIALSLPLDANP